MKSISTFWLLAVLLCLGTGVRAADVVTLSTVQGAPGAEVTVSVGMTNTDAVGTLQLSLPLGDHLTYVEGSATATDRLAGHSLTAGVKDGVLNLVVFNSEAMAAISGESGELLSFRLKLDELPIDIPLQPSQLLLVAPDGTQLTGETQAGSVSIRCAKAQYAAMEVGFGRCPIQSTYTRAVTVSNVGNEPLDITAIDFSDETFSTTTTLPLTVAAGARAQLNVAYAPVKRGTVAAEMKVACNSISKLNTIRLTAEPFAVNELHVGNVSGISDDVVTVPLTMNNMDGITTIQLEFNLPDDLEYVDGSFALSDRKDDHQATVTCQDGLLRIVAFSTGGKAFQGADGQIASFDVKLTGRYSVTLRPAKAVLTATVDGVPTNVLSQDYAGTVTIMSPKLSAGSTLDFGDQSLTGDVQQAFSVWNNGQVPLTISRVLFSDERFSVKEELPLVVDAWSNATLTVQNSDRTAGDFSAKMQIYSNDPDRRLHEVNLSGRVISPNYLTVAADDAFTGSDVVLHVHLDNHEPIVGLQFDVVSAEGYTVDGSKISLADRSKGLDVTVRKVDEQTLRVVGYMMGSGIAAGNGEIMTIRLTPSEQLSEGIRHLSVKNVTLGSSDMQNQYVGSGTQAVDFQVREFLRGDANGDKVVDVSDVVVTVNKILGKSPAVFVFGAADVNNDGDIDVSDVVGIVNIILNKG